MRFLVGFMVGALTGLAIYRPAGRALDRYANHSLPPEYNPASAAMRYFNGGVEVKEKA